MQVFNGKARINDGETQKEREYRGRIEKLERQVEDLKKRLPPPPVPLNGEQKQ